MLIRNSELFKFFDLCIDGKIPDIRNVILPSLNKFGKTGQTFFANYKKDGQFLLNSFRTIDPSKMLYYLAREKMLIKKQDKKFILAGIKNCDLRALDILDKALINDEFVDPSYKHWRDSAIIVTTDCHEITETCHCTLMGGKPYSESGFDLNMALVNDSWLLTPGSDKGHMLIKLFNEHVNLSEPADMHSNELQKQRKSMLAKVEKQNKAFERDNESLHLEQKDMDFWIKESKTCVGCGACTNICPTCYCLILNDESENNKFIKVRSYDSCQYNGYARVAGGGTPREKMHQRFRNRYLCKFSFMKSNFDTYGCTGCGRCTEACPGEIDFRSVVKNATIIKQESKAENVS